MGIWRQIKDTKLHLFCHFSLQNKLANYRRCKSQASFRLKKFEPNKIIRWKSLVISFRKHPITCFFLLLQKNYKTFGPVGRVGVKLNDYFLQSGALV